MLLLAFFASAEPAGADWVDNWMKGTTASYTGPNYFEGQKRNFGSFGAFSVRQYALGREPLAGFTPPSLHLGCGGIDVFMGGWNFMNFQYLVTKFKKIISAAPAFAFQYALSSISPQITSVMNRLESASDLLNQVQLDDCKASRTIGVFAVDALEGKKNAMSKAWAGMKEATGTDSLYQTAKTALMSGSDSGTPEKPSPGDLQDLNSGCPRAIRDLVGHSSLLEYMGAKGYLPNTPGLISFLRGYVGDVVFKWSSSRKKGDMTAVLLPWCGGENEASFKAFVDGTAWENPGTNGLRQCRQMTGTNIRAEVEKAITDTYTNMVRGAKSSSAAEAVINMIPFPVYDQLRACYMLNDPAASSAILGMIYEPASYGLGYALLTNVYTETIKAISLIEYNEIKVCRLNAGNSQKNRCFICKDSSLEDALDGFKKNIRRRMQEARQIWANQQRIYAGTMNLLLNVKAINKRTIVNRILGGRHK